MAYLLLERQMAIAFQGGNKIGSKALRRLPQTRSEASHSTINALREETFGRQNWTFAGDSRARLHSP